MNNTDQKQNGLNSYYERYSDYTDTQILDILRRQKDYQEAAVLAATKLAIERQIIHSEQDLMAPEFQQIKSEKFTFFPEIKNDYQQQRLIGSIFRFLYVISLIPIAYGFLQYAEGQINQTFLGISAGVVWFSLCILLRKSRKIMVFIPLFLLLTLILVFIGIKIFTPEIFRFLDLVMLIIGTLLPTYMLLFLKKLIQRKFSDLK